MRVSVSVSATPVPAGTPVRVQGVVVGHAATVVVDRESDRVLGFDVRCRDGALRFLPLLAAEVGEEAIAVPSALSLLEGDAAAFYRRRAAPGAPASAA